MLVATCGVHVWWSAAGIYTWVAVCDTTGGPLLAVFVTSACVSLRPVTVLVPTSLVTPPRHTPLYSPFQPGHPPLPQLRQTYREALEGGIPCHMQTGDLWDSIEVKTALALLRCVVNPDAAGGVMARRLIKSDSGVKVPVTAGLGEREEGEPLRIFA